MPGLAMGRSQSGCRQSEWIENQVHEHSHLSMCTDANRETLIKHQVLTSILDTHHAHNVFIPIYTDLHQDSTVDKETCTCSWSIQLTSNGGCV